MNGCVLWDFCFIDGSMGEDEVRIVICDDLLGWLVWIIKEDEELSKKDFWGERRYVVWRVIFCVLDLLRNGFGDVISCNYRFIMMRLWLL